MMKVEHMEPAQKLSHPPAGIEKREQGRARHPEAPPDNDISSSGLHKAVLTTEAQRSAAQSSKLAAGKQCKQEVGTTSACKT